MSPSEVSDFLDGLWGFRDNKDGVEDDVFDHALEREPTARPGVYALVMEAAEALEVTVGKLGLTSISPGYYVYVGSAFGPGGLKARVGRHLREDKKPHWHIDHLRRVLPVREVWWSEAQRSAEHQWASVLEGMGQSAHPRFGSSDCRCPSHLLRFEEKPPLDAFREKLAGEDHPPIFRLDHLP